MLLILVESNTHSSVLFELVYYVVWDYRFFSLLGTLDIFFFLDDFSCITWIYLLKEKSAVSHMIEFFYKEIK